MDQFVDTDGKPLTLAELDDLSPGPKHLPVQRFVTPEQFESFRRHGEDQLGFLQVVSSPLTRSSYLAAEVQRLMATHPR